MMNHIDIYTDGACSGNPGPAGAAFVDFSQSLVIAKRAKHLGHSTNNIAELKAIEMAIDYLLEDNRHINRTVTIHSDSNYAINCLTQWIHNWRNNGFKNKKGKPVQNAQLIQSISAKLEQVEEITFTHVPAHSGIPGNEAADDLATDAVQNILPNKPIQSEPRPPVDAIQAASLKIYSNTIKSIAQGDSSLREKDNALQLAHRHLSRASDVIAYYEAKYGPVPAE